MIMAAKKPTTMWDKDPMKMNKEEKREWEQKLLEETIKPRIIGYSDTETGARQIIGKKKRCHIEKEGKVFLVIQAKAR
jgi:hypothetical protein